LSQVILDLGVFIASVYPETLTLQAKGLLRQLEEAQIVLHAPTLLRYELVAVSRKAVYQARVTAQAGRIARDQLLTFDELLQTLYAKDQRGQ
jgi:predicted nucleic acid-binding protein